MQLRAAVWVGLVAAGCVHPGGPIYKPVVDQALAKHPTRTDRIEPPSPLATRPLTVGVWALYRRYQGFDLITVVAEDACGIWVDFKTQTYDRRDSWLLCVRPGATDPLQMAIRERVAGAPLVIDFRQTPNPKLREELDYFVTRVMPIDWSTIANPGPEAIDVPAGRFIQALRTEQPDGTYWTHPAVPFDGMVRTQSADGDYVLVAYGDDAKPSILAGFARSLDRARTPQARQPRSLDLGVGLGWLSGHRDQVSSSATEFHVRYGLRLSRDVDAVATVSVLYGAEYSPDATLRQDAVMSMAGARWTVVRAPCDLYVQADAGYADLQRTAKSRDRTSDAGGLAAGGSVGARAHYGQDWSAFLEISDHALVLGSGEGVRNAIAVSVGLQVDLGSLF